MNKLIRKILLTHFTKLETDFQTIFEGVKTTPKLPYQSLYLQPTTSSTRAISDRPHAEFNGYLQITLNVALGAGTAMFDEQADLISQHFYGQTFIEQGLQLVIQQPPQIGGIFFSEGHLAMPITVYYTAFQL